MNWYVKTYPLGPSVQLYPDTAGLLLLRTHVREQLSSPHDTLVCVQIRVADDRQPHRYWWRSVVSFRPPKGVPHTERRDMLNRMFDMVAAQFGTDYRIAPNGDGDGNVYGCSDDTSSL